MTQLVINLPPRTLKTFLCSVVYPVFAAIREPGTRVMHLAGHRDLHGSILADLIKLLASPRLLAIFPELALKKSGADLAFENGSSIYLGVYGAEIIGRGFDLCIVDDPQSPKTVRNRREREESNLFFNDSVLTRKNSSAKARMLIVQQRLHRSDLSGHVLQNESWKCVSLSAIAYQDRRWRIRGDEYGYAKGEALFPAMESREELNRKLIEIGGVQFLAQYQQTPLSEDNPTEEQGYYYYRKEATGWEGMFGRVSQARWVYEEIFANERTVSKRNPEPLTPEQWELKNSPGG